jgi:hypothetical protein
MDGRNLVEIVPGPDGLPTSDQVLAYLEPEALGYMWYVLELRGVAKKGLLGGNVLDFERRVRESEHGLGLDWSTLRKIVQEVTDLWELMLVGIKGESVVSRSSPRERLYETADLVVERIDSAEWLIFARDDRLVSKLATKASGARDRHR